MATQQLQLVCDSSTLTNFKAWAKPISDWFATCGWTQATDTGQVVWTASVVSITAASLSGSNTTYTYTLSSGPVLRVGMSLVITGMGNAGNNGTFTITSLATGTFTVVNASGVTASSQSGSGTTTALAAVPGTAAYIYEVWQPGDALTTFYAKIEYGNVSGANCPSLKISLATSTNGAGTVAGISFGPVFVNSSVFTPPSTTTQYECNFSGSSSRMNVMMWRNAPADQGQSLFCIERSIDSTGAYTSGYISLWVQGFNGNHRGAQQKSLVFGVGTGPGPILQDGANAGWNLRDVNTATSAAFNGSFPIDFPAPQVGYHDFPCTACGYGCGLDLVEGVTFTATLYGTSHTYMPSKIGPFAYTKNNLNNGGAGSNGYATFMRYD